jgi:hypothetical protein
VHISNFTVPLVALYRLSIPQQTEDMFACSALISEHIEMWTCICEIWEDILGRIDKMLASGDFGVGERAVLQNLSAKITRFVEYGRMEVSESEEENIIVTDQISASIAENSDVDSGESWLIFNFCKKNFSQKPCMTNLTDDIVFVCKNEWRVCANFRSEKFSTLRCVP